MDPIHDAVGKLVSRCVTVEIFLRLRVEQLDPAVNNKQLHAFGPSWCARRLQELAYLVPGDEREELDHEMQVALKIFELRNGVVHGFYDTTLEGAPIPTLVTGRPDRKTGEWIETRFNRDLLIGAADRAYRVWGYLQSRTTWPDLSDD